ncbi:MAG: HNH endonuclease [Nannocystaceae bacterium]
MDCALPTLLLNLGYQPIKVISWRRAVCMNFLGRVEVVSDHDVEIRTVSSSYPVPAVVRLLHHTRVGPRVVRFSRRNVYLRDRFTCQYCGRRFAERELTLDHVVPRSRGGRMEWSNIVAACVPCNGRKGRRSPEQVGLCLQALPRQPSNVPGSAAQLGVERVPSVWLAWLPRGRG